MYVDHPCELAVPDVSPDYETACTSKEHGIGCSSKKYRPGITTKSLKGFLDNNHVPTCFQHKHLRKFSMGGRRKPRLSRLAHMGRVSVLYLLFFTPHMQPMLISRKRWQKWLAHCCTACKGAVYELPKKIS